MIKPLNPETEKLEYPNGDKYIGELADKKEMVLEYMFHI